MVKATRVVILVTIILGISLEVLLKKEENLRASRTALSRSHLGCIFGIPLSRAKKVKSPLSLGS
jgi:hypothetical protein